jgi:cytochrome P450 family 6
MWIYLILLLLSLIYIWYRKRYSHWERLGFPYVPGKFPFGVGLQFISEHNNYFFHNKYEEFKNKAPAFGFYFFNIRTLIPTDLDLIKEILVKSFDTFHDRGFNFNDAKDPLLVNIFNTRGQKWKDLRTKMTPTFTTGRIKAMFPIILTITNRLTEFLTDKNEVEIREAFQQISVEIITSTTLGIDTKCLGEKDKNEFFEIAKRSSDPPPRDGILTLFAMSFGKLFNFLKLRIVPEEITFFFMKVLHDSVLYREKNQILRHDFFQLMVNMMKNPEIKLSFEEMAASCHLFFTAG